jgi:hypothetical protein
VHCWLAHQALLIFSALISGERSTEVEMGACMVKHVPLHPVHSWSIILPRPNARFSQYGIVAFHGSTLLNHPQNAVITCLCMVSDALTLLLLNALQLNICLYQLCSKHSWLPITMPCKHMQLTVLPHTFVLHWQCCHAPFSSFTVYCGTWHKDLGVWWFHGHCIVCYGGLTLQNRYLNTAVVSGLW